MQEIGLIPGSDTAPEEAAIDRSKLEQHQISSLALSNELQQNLAPIASLLRPGCGIALVLTDEDHAEVIGLKV